MPIIALQPASIVLRIIGKISVILSSLFIVLGCQNINRSIGIIDSQQSTLDTLFVSSSQDYALTSLSSLPAPSFVILKENDQTMYSEISKIVDSSDRFFILDTWGSRKLVSFDHSGAPITSYGRRGNGPGEYVLPTDFDIDNNKVYLLDNADKTLLVFKHDGTFISQLKMPFFAAAICKLNNGNFLFNIDVDAELGYQLCVTDSLLNPLSYMIPYPTDYVGGWITGDPLRKTADGISYYSSPADTIYHLDNFGNLITKTTLLFETGSIDNSAKLDYIKAVEQGLLNKGGMHLLDNPIILPDGRGYGKIDDAQKRHILFFDTISKNSGIIKISDMTAFSPILPSASSYDGHLISFLAPEIMDNLIGKDELPDSIKTALEDGCRVLTIF